MQQTLTGCAFCDARPGAETGEAHTWGQTNGSPTRAAPTARSSRSQVPTCPITPLATPCGLVIDALAALTRFRVELGHLEGPLQLCERCSPDGLATYWTRKLEKHSLSSSYPSFSANVC